ncbi:MAG: reverse transcriptase-like protein [Caldilineaceae bacterium]|nr:reverse transcriptase-like protein [Caldilineaceae bacterium]
MMERLTLLLEEIGQLTPAQRRRLFRQAQLMGLLDREDLLTDRNALQIVPAVQKRTTLPPAETRPARPTSTNGDEATYRSPVSGRVVVGAPEQEGDPPASVMRPLPGQAPEQPIRIVFDGGSKGNPGQGYGSYALEWPTYPRQVVRLQFGNQVTNNEAEYDTLISALEAVIKRLTETGADPRTAKVEIWGDSQLVINQVNGEWEANKAEMRVRRDKARALLERFGTARLRYHGRDNNVEILGH